MSIYILIQARLSSSRLPGKVLFPLTQVGETAIQLIDSRIRLNSWLAKNCKIIILTSEDACDDAIVHHCNENNILYFRGSRDDVLSRYFMAATKHSADLIVRLTSDCPLIDPWEIQRVVESHNLTMCDYSTNSFNSSTIIDGFDVEVFSYDALRRAHHEALLPSEREHVTFYMKDSNDFHVNLICPNLTYEYQRLTLDTPYDYLAIRKFLTFHPEATKLKMQEIVELFIKSGCSKINKHIPKSEGWESAFLKDREYLNSKHR